jgi:hypothetical protein
MSEDILAQEEGIVVKDDTSKEKPKKGPKPKKRPSDFEITRTILQRTCERKLPYLLKNIAEDKDVLLLCSEKEEGFSYGSPSLSLGFIEFDNPELKDIVRNVLEKTHGFSSENQVVINLRDQISELSKTKGESMDVETFTKDPDCVWTVRKDVTGKERELYFCQSVESLYHFQLVSVWVKQYKDLLYTKDPNHLYYPYVHTEAKTHSLLKIPPLEELDHPISKLYPHGFRTMLTKGIDILISKMFEPHFPYPIVSEEIIVFLSDGAVCQMAHRVIGDGWRMLLIRPNAYFFPHLDIKIPKLGNHSL